VSVSTSNYASLLEGNAFMNLFITQLKHQDPLSPMDSSQMTSQLAQLTTVQSLSSMQKTFSSALTVERLKTAQALIGHSVQYTDSTTQQTVTGTVQKVAVQSGEPGIVIGDKFVSLDSLTAVLD